MSLSLVLHTLLRLKAPIILNFHGVGEGLDNLPPDTFLAIVHLLRSQGYSFITADGFTNARLCLQRVAALTFDDGRKNNFSVVLPLLRKTGAAATFYVCPALIGRRVRFNKVRWSMEPFDRSLCSGLMSWSNIRELVAAGMCVGSHTLTHADLARCPDEVAWRELVDSRRILEHELRIPIRHLAYPFGQRTPRTRALARRAGYLTAVATGIRANPRSQLHSRYDIPRINIGPDVTLESFRSLTSLSAQLRRTMRRLLPSRLWHWRRLKPAPSVLEGNDPGLVAGSE